MESGKTLGSMQIIILGVCIALATIVSSVIFSKTMMNIKRFTTEVISVTGHAEKPIMSDYVVWRSSFGRRDAQITAAYASLKDDLKKVREYLLSHGISESEITVSQVDTTVLNKRNDKGYDTNEIEGYTLTQRVEVRSNNVQKVTEISRQSTELINQGIGFFSESPEYFYTKISELKVAMLALATQNAKQRAEFMAKATGNKIGIMRSASMGVFQITSVNSFDVSGSGMYDTMSPEKKVTSVVHVDFTLEE
jgi:uncharacterized protein